jgi:hypothetical protein
LALHPLEIGHVFTLRFIYWTAAKAATEPFTLRSYHPCPDRFLNPVCLLDGVALH